MRRLQFIRRLVVSGLRWAKELADHVLLLLGLLVLVAGIAVGGVLLNRPAWFLGGAAGVLVLLTLGEGAYRTWDEADRRAEAAQAALAGEHTKDAVASRLDDFRREYERLGAEAPPEQTGVGPVVTDQQARWNFSANHISEQVSSELRQNAPGFLSYWRTPSPVRLAFSPFGDYAEALIDMSVEQLREISERLREGHDEP